MKILLKKTTRVNIIKSNYLSAPKCRKIVKVDYLDG